MEDVTRKKGRIYRINNHECALQMEIIKINLLLFSKRNFVDKNFKTLGDKK